MYVQCVWVTVEYFLFLVYFSVFLVYFSMFYVVP